MNDSRRLESPTDAGAENTGSDTKKSGQISPPSAVLPGHDHDTARPEPEPATDKKKKKKKKKKKLGSNRGVETMFRTTYRTHLDLSQIADNKANIMISINGLIISVVIASISPKIDANPWLLVPTGVLLIACSISLVFSVLAARPRVTSNPVTLDDVVANRANILFFGNFVSLTQDEYLEGMKTLVQNTDRLYTSMMRDIYGLGGVLMRKYALLRTAYTTFMVGLVTSVALFILVFIWITPGSGLTVG